MLWLGWIGAQLAHVFQVDAIGDRSAYQQMGDLVGEVIISH
ncbi:hypothetical protein MesoLj113c_40450 [Mesorhizobium sp. 113-3-9]|nr:hypothetical protein MesoLj113c_40450 [Mesorhizobium sp. 113-3-9]